MDIGSHNSIKLQNTEALFMCLSDAVPDQLLPDVQSSFFSAYRIAGITDVSASSHIVGMQDIETKYFSCLILCYAAVCLLRKKFSAAFISFCVYSAGSSPYAFCNRICSSSSMG